MGNVGGAGEEEDMTLHIRFHYTGHTGKFMDIFLPLHLGYSNYRL